MSCWKHIRSQILHFYLMIYSLKANIFFYSSFFLSSQVMDFQWQSETILKF